MLLPGTGTGFFGLCVRTADSTAGPQLLYNFFRGFGVGHIDRKKGSEIVVLRAGVEWDKIDGEALYNLGELRTLFFLQTMPSEFPCQVGIKLNVYSHVLGSQRVPKLLNLIIVPSCSRHQETCS